MHDVSQPLAGPHSDPETLLEVIAESLQLVALHANLGVGHAMAGDHAGIGYSVRPVGAYLRIAAGTAADLLERFPPDGRADKQWQTEEGP
jgi:hypothetical protein